MTNMVRVRRVSQLHSVHSIYKREELLQAVSREELERSIYRDSFWDFVQAFWPVISTEILQTNWHMEAICYYLQDVAERVFKGLPRQYDIVINVPPGTSKSSLCSVLFPAWMWTVNPAMQSLCGSYSYPLALDLSRKSRDVVTSNKWKNLYPDIKLRADQSGKGHFMTEQGGFRYAVGTGGAATGFHGHFIIIDDPIDPTRAVSTYEIQSASRWVNETMSSRKVDKKVSVTILVMQRLHQDDPSAVLLRRNERKRAIPVKHLKFPGEIIEDGLKEVRPRKFAKYYKDGLMDPRRMPREVLEDTQEVLGRYGYAGQILQTPVPPGGGMFRTDLLAIQPVAPVKLQRVIRYWDKAGTKGAGCYTVGVKMAEDTHGHYWVIDVVRGQWESAMRERIIEQTANLDGYDVEVGLEQEPGSGGKDSARATMRRLAGWRVKSYKQTGEKELRADTFSIQVNAENVTLVSGTWNKEFIDELKFFPYGSYLDQVDAAAGAFSVIAKDRVIVGAFKLGGR